MAAESSSPNSFRDPYWSDLATKAAQKYDVPPSLLVSVLTNGERSNANQVSEVGAKTPFQVTPTTRALILKRDGIDAYLSDENAADAAALTLKDGLNWAKTQKGDPNALAAGYYHAGGDLKNWGPRTNAYIGRVVNAPDFRASQAQAQDQAAAASAKPWEGPSTYDQLTASMGAVKPSENAMANMVAAYQSGKMTPEDAKAFESQVQAGKIVLPGGPGAVTPPKTGQAAEGGQFLPKGVADAYRSNKMSTEDKQAVEGLLRQGYRLPGEIPVGQNEGAGPGYVPTTPNEPTKLQQVVGAGETALSLGTGLVGAPVGAVYGGVKGMFDPNVTNIQQLEQAAGQGAANLTYAPRTAAGQAQTAAVGDVMQNAVPVMGLTPQLGQLGQAAQLAKPTVQALPAVARNVAGQAMQEVASRVPAPIAAVPSAIASGVRKAGVATGLLDENAAAARPTATAATPGTAASAGAAATDLAAQRRATAEGLDVPVRLTEGEATRQHPQQQFEGETAKMPNAAGEMLRQRSAENNAAIIKNFDTWMDKTERQATDTMGVGKSLTGALDKGLENRKNEYRVKYAAAKKAGETSEFVDTTPLADALNKAYSAEGSAPIIGAVKKELQRLGGAALDENGNVVGGKLSINDMEDMRKFIGKTTKATDSTDLMYGGELRNAVDQIMDGAPGELFKEARASYRRTQELYKDNALIKDLISKKKGTTDRKVALENVVNRTILGGSREDLGKLRRTLLVDGSEQGKQAWKDIQGATLQYLADEANANPLNPKSAVTDTHGNPIVSAAGLNKAVQALDKSEKLQFILGKEGAQKVRDINETVGLIKTFPPGTINTSNTTATLLTALAEAGTTGAFTGLPVPVLSLLRAGAQKMKNRRLETRVAAALAQSKPQPIKGLP